MIQKLAFISTDLTLEPRDKRGVAEVHREGNGGCPRDIAAKYQEVTFYVISYMIIMLIISN